MVTCGKCGTTLVDGALFCHMCGAKLQNSYTCKQCGQEVKVGSKFCGKCGTPVTNTENTVNQQNNTSHCPNCGALVGRLDVACPSCGTAITNRNIAMSVNVFATELARIEAERLDSNSNEKRGLFGNGGTDYEQAYGSKYLDKKISFIQSFPIPNTTEEIVEFILLAMANIDPTYGNKKYDNNRTATVGHYYYSEVKMANTWIGKLEQAYNKAMLLFPDNPLFPKIQELYQKKMKELDRL